MTNEQPEAKRLYKGRKSDPLSDNFLDHSVAFQRRKMSSSAVLNCPGPIGNFARSSSVGLAVNFLALSAMCRLRALQSGPAASAGPAAATGWVQLRTAASDTVAIYQPLL